MIAISRSLVCLCSLTLLASCALGSPALRQPQATRLGSLSNRAVPKPEVIQIASPNHNERPAGATISTIVLHHTAMAENAREVGAYFAKPSAKTSSHYIVDRSGYIVQPVDDSRRSWHAGASSFNGQSDVNNFSIGIEICNLGDSVEPYSDAQYDGIIRLVAHLVSQYRVPIESITRHRDIAVPKGRKIDTSNNFSVPRVLDGVRAVLNGTYKPPVPATAPLPPVPAFREVTVQAGQHSFEDLADIYLDNPSRAPEIQALNPQFSAAAQLQVGQKIKLPTNLAFFKHQH